MSNNVAFTRVFHRLENINNVMMAVETTTVEINGDENNGRMVSPFIIEGVGF